MLDDWFCEMRTKQDPENHQLPWSEEELILAFELYCRIPFRKTKANNPEVKELAFLVRRSPAAVARKLGNFGAFDPELQRRNISGLKHGSKLDREIWEAFHKDWNGLVLEANKLPESLNKGLLETNPALIRPSGPSEKVRNVKQRVHQAFFRQAVLSSYEETCCITGLRVPECLIARHIVPWAEDARYRTDPTNGLCLSATFDRLFDNGLFTLSDDFVVQISKRLKKSTDRSVKEIFCVYDGKSIVMPGRFLPSSQRLKWHRETVFAG